VTCRDGFGSMRLMAFALNAVPASITLKGARCTMAPKTVTAAEIAACGGMAPDTRRYWVRKKLLESGAFSEHDAVDTAIAAVLTEGTTTQRSTAAFSALRQRLREEVLAGRSELWVVIPQKGLEFRLAHSADEAAKLAAEMRGARGPVWLVPIGDAIERAKERYARCVAAAEQETGAVRPLRLAGGPRASDRPVG
jgi:hypothetical protein